MPLWGFEYGDEWGGVESQGSTAAAKEDTVFLALSGVMATDQSGFATNLTPASGGGYELNSARAALTSSRELYVRCEFTAAEINRVIVHHGLHDASDQTFAIGTDGLGQFVLVQNGAFVWIGPPTPASDISIAWSTRANPDTTGATNAMISEVVIYDHVIGNLEVLEQFTHAAPTTDPTWTLSVHGWWDGAVQKGQTASTPSKCRISGLHHSTTEFAEDWVAVRTSHVSELVELVEPLGAGAPAGAQGDWAGQANVGFAAAHANALRGRMLSPMVREVYPNARTLVTTPAPTSWILPAPGSAKYLLDATLLRWLPITGWDRAQVRVWVRSWVTAGAAVPIGIRVYAMNRIHIGLGVKLEGQPMPALQYEFVEATLTADHIAPAGAWLDLGKLALASIAQQIEGWTGTVTLGLAYAFDPSSSSANDANARLKILGWEVEPLVGEA